MAFYAWSENDNSSSGSWRVQEAGPLSTNGSGPSSACHGTERGGWFLEPGREGENEQAKKKRICKNNDHITARSSHHKHVSCGHVFVHHKPGVLLSTNPGPLTQSHGEPTCGDTTDDVTPAGSEELCMFFFSLLFSLHFNTLIINPRLAGQTRPTEPSNLAGNWITNDIKRSNFILLCHTQGINQSKQINTKTL